MHALAVEEIIVAAYQGKANIQFNAVDVPLLFSFAKQLIAGNHLTEKQLAYSQRIISKYGAIQKTPSQEPSEIEIRNGKIYVQTSFNDKSLINRCKYLLKFTWDAKENAWRGSDNALNRIVLDLPLPKTDKVGINLSKYEMLRDYQIKDIHRMIGLGSALNANEMGLGKTLEALIALQYVFYEKILIVAPKSVLYNWKNELIKWDICSDDNISIITGSVKERRDALKDLKQFVIVNYDLLASKHKKKQDKVETNSLLIELQQYDWDMIIADEAHRIKNKDAARSIGLKSLKATNRFALTGTPIQNRPDDLWNIIHWINPFYSGNSYWKFVELFCELENNGYGFKITGLSKDPQRIQWLNTLLDHIMIRNEKKNVLKDLPDKIYQQVSLQMSEKQKKLYATVKKEILFELESGQEITISNALTRLLRLQQVTSVPELFGIQENPKFDAAVDIIKDNEAKVVIFSRFATAIGALMNRLNSEDIKYTSITGSVKGNRQDIIKEFQKNPDVKVFLGTIGAAGEGIDGLQSVADTVIFLDREWSPAKNAQAEDRIYRFGQTRGVQIIDLVMQNTIDSWVEYVLSKKISDIVTLIK